MGLADKGLVGAGLAAAMAGGVEVMGIAGEGFVRLELAASGRSRELSDRGEYGAKRDDLRATAPRDGTG